MMSSPSSPAASCSWPWHQSLQGYALHGNTSCLCIVTHSSLFVCFSVWLLAPQLLCIYLGWVLATILKDMCVVCTSTYFVNAYIVYKAWRNFLATGASSDKKTK